MLQQKGVAGGVFFGGVDQNTLRAFGRFFIEIPLALFLDDVAVEVAVDDSVEVSRRDFRDIVESFEIVLLPAFLHKGR